MSEGLLPRRSFGSGKAILWVCVCVCVCFAVRGLGGKGDVNMLKRRSSCE